jgi:hypothetical protein
LAPNSTTDFPSGRNFIEGHFSQQLGGDSGKPSGTT